jgi:L-ascorbate metabolism protein UlaG (beta-lactamase superfamily)
VVALSHDDQTHFSLQGLGSDFHMVTGAGEYEIRGVSLRGVQTYHDDKKGPGRQKNFVYVIDIDDLRACHLGHLGHALTEAQLDGIGSKIDILFIPVGGGTHINSTQATEIVAQIEPKLVIPISYRLPGLNLFGQTLDPLEKFVKEMGVAEAPPQPKLQLNSSPSTEEPKLTVLEARGAAAATAASVD